MKTVVISGAAQGIGKVISEKLCEYSYQVIGIDKDEEAIAEQQNRMKYQRIQFLPFDLAQSHEIESLCQRVEKEYGNVFGLINNAAISYNKKLEDLNLDEWEEAISVNLTAPLLLVKFLAPLLTTSKGAVVNICSTRALMSEPDTEAYSASKGGLLSLTHSLAMSLAPDVRVNAVSPGWIETRGLQKMDKRQDIIHREKDKIQHPVGRVGEATDVAELVNYLLSDKAGFITGQNFVVDGGMTKKMIYEE